MTGIKQVCLLSLHVRFSLTDRHIYGLPTSEAAGLTLTAKTNRFGYVLMGGGGNK